jgi:hypothetical protein
MKPPAPQTTIFLPLIFIVSPRLRRAQEGSRLDGYELSKVLSGCEKLRQVFVIPFTENVLGERNDKNYFLSQKPAINVLRIHRKNG